MYRADHPEVLSREWIPPYLPGRAEEVDRLWRALYPHPYPGRSATALIVGPPDSGSTAVARTIARRLAEHLATAGATARPLTIEVPVGLLHGTHGIATRLLQAFDEGFCGRGFPVNEVLAGFLRRLRRSGRPAILLLDGLGPAAPDLAPVLRALSEPDRFLPEGQSGLPAVWTLATGHPEAVAALGKLRRCPLALPPVELAEYSVQAVWTILADRASRALGRPVPPEALAGLLRVGRAGDSPLRAGLEALRELFGLEASGNRCTSRDGVESVAREVEPRLLALLREVGRGGPARVGRLRRAEAQLAAAQGLRPLPATTFWRRIVRLEAAGLVRRSVRPGGAGGTCSVLEVVGAIPNPAHRPGRSPRSDGGADAGSGRWPVPGEPAGPARVGPVAPGGAPPRRG